MSSGLSDSLKVIIKGDLPSNLLRISELNVIDTINVNEAPNSGFLTLLTKTVLMGMVVYASYHLINCLRSETPPRQSSRRIALNEQELRMLVHSILTDANQSRGTNNAAPLLRNDTLANSAAGPLLDNGEPVFMRLVDLIDT